MYLGQLISIIKNYCYEIRLDYHMPWYTGGKHIPAKWRYSLKASRWSKRWQSVITRSHNHPTSDGSDILVRSMTGTTGNFHVEYPATSLIEVSYELLRYYENQCVCSRTLDRISYETHHQWLMHVDSPTCMAIQDWWKRFHSISNRYWTLQRSCRLYTMRTCLSSFFCSEKTLHSNHNFLIESIIIYVLSFSHRES